jgi:hypothetical protein
VAIVDVHGLDNGPKSNAQLRAVLTTAAERLEAAYATGK